MLKLFFGGDGGAFALDHAAHHRELAESFEAARERARERGVEMPPGRRVVLDTGIELHRWWERRWTAIAAELGGRPGP